ncbi:DUF58 domain-containing protein [Sagittula sp. NFXS13]|uniref:DUF58 domain-containing protein n=1 Tax=Sagittula sp. NFXS13 TaxID=2819095 RepID=UPI0032E01D73
MSAPAQTTRGVTLTADPLIALRQVALRVRGQPVMAALPGGFVTRRKGHGQDIADVRSYLPGDDLRHLDRGSTARTGVLHVRQFMDERDRVTLLVADFRAPMLWGLKRAFRSVAAAEALVLLGWQAVEEGGRVGLLALTGGTPVAVRPRGRARGMLEVIGGLVTAHAQALKVPHSLPLDVALDPVGRIAPRGAEVVIASGFDAPGALHDRFADLSRCRYLHLLRLSDAEAGGLPRGRYPIRLANGRRLRVAVSGKAAPPPDISTISGQAALRLDAAWPIDQLAQRLAAAFPTDRVP